jgi:GAF domain-containing protein
MIPQTQLLDFFVELADVLVEGYDVVEFLHDLTVKAAAVSGAEAVGLVLTDQQDRIRYMASNNAEGKLLELFQIQNDDGPCREAIRTGVPVVNANLGEAADRWPLFAPAARAAGFQSVHAFPLRVQEHTIGALNIFGTDDVHFDPDDVRAVQALTHVATISIVTERNRYQAEEVAEQLQSALDSRVVVEQAKGALARAESITASEAFDVMRTTARATRQKVSDVAIAVIASLEAHPPRNLRRKVNPG